MNVTPEHLHVALNHLPFLGGGLAVIPLLFGIITKSRPAMLAGLTLAAVAGWSTPLVMATGEAAYERYEKGPVARFLDPGAETYLEQHEARAHTWSKVMYASAVAATVGLLLSGYRERWSRPAAGISLVFCVASLLAGVWIAEAGGKIRRPDFRAGQITQNFESGTPEEHDYGRERHDDD